RKNPETIAERLAEGGRYQFDTAAFVELESERKRLQTMTEEAQARRNALAKLIGMKKGKREDASAELAEAAELPEQLKQLEAQLAVLQKRMTELVSQMPNVPHESVPKGRSSDDNVEVRRIGTPRQFD